MTIDMLRAALIDHLPSLLAVTKSSTLEILSMPVLVYGPSGVGKSTAFRRVRTLLPDRQFAELDDLIDIAAKRLGLQGLHHFARERGADEFLELGRRQVEEHPARDSLIVDVGAFCLDAAGFRDWLTTTESIVLIASREVAYNRIRARKEEKRTFTGYYECEFSPRRELLYRLARHRIDTNELSDTEVATALSHRLTAIV